MCFIHFVKKRLLEYSLLDTVLKSHVHTYFLYPHTSHPHHRLTILLFLSIAQKFIYKKGRALLDLDIFYDRTVCYQNDDDDHQHHRH